MELLNSICDISSYEKVKAYKFYSLLELKQYIYGAPLIEKNTLNKLEDLTEIFAENGETENKAFVVANAQTSGIRLRFFTNSSEIIFKVRTTRKWEHQKMLMACSSGFDIYFIDENGARIHVTAFAQEAPNNIYAHKISLFGKPRMVEIYFPLYNGVDEFFMGIDEGSVLTDCVEYSKKTNIIFYGHSCTQGASASRSGNAYPNIVSRNLDCDITNYAFSACCRGEIATAKQIILQCAQSKYNIGAIVLDYNRNAKSLREFESRFEKFYYAFRDVFPKVPIIIVGAAMQPAYDYISRKTFMKCLQNGENTFFLDLTQLFKDFDEVSITPDRIHYTDTGMFVIADKICEYLKQGSSDFY